MNKIRNRLKKLSEMQEIQQLENEVTKVFLGDEEVLKIYLGEHLIYVKQ